jgi:hypothetical protein
MISTSHVEKGLKVFLDAELETTLVIEAASATPVPDVEQWVQVKCAKVPHVAGPDGAGGLYDGEVELAVCTPSGVENITEANHRTLLEALKAVMVEDNLEDISTAMNEAASANVQGWYLTDVQDEHGNGQWKTKLAYMFALEGG